jgi:CheY-like chemotaxis protein
MLSSGPTCLVDDSADYRALLQFYFNRHFPQYSFRVFPGGQSLLDALPQMDTLPNLILLDRHMPGLDGHQTLTILKQHPTYKRIPVVMMSAEASETEINGCYESGANSFLKKNPRSGSLEESLLTICRYWLELNQVPSMR